MKRINIIISTLLLLCISCTKEYVSSSNVECSDVLNVCIADDSRVKLDEREGEVYPMTWQTGDKIFVNGSVTSQSLAEQYNGTKSAVFSLPQKMEYPLTVVYPAELCSGANISIPRSLAYDANKLCSGYGILIGYAENDGKDITMNHMCGYVRVALTGSKNISKVRLSSVGHEIISGNYVYDLTVGELQLTPNSGSEVNTASYIELTTSTSLSTNPTAFYFAVPAAMEFSKGIRITVTDTDGKQMSKTAFSSGKKFSKGIVVELPTLEYVAGEPETEIFAVSENEVSFDAHKGKVAKFTITTYNEDVNVTTQGAEWIDYKFPTVIPSDRTLEIDMLPVSSNVSEKREATITLTGAQTGTKKTVKLNQKDLYTPSYGFPARWEIHKDGTYVSNGVKTAEGEMWINEGIATSTIGAGVGKSYISAGSTVGNKLGYTVDVSASTKTLAVTNMGEGDYILFSVPVVDLPAGVDFDFMITINSATTTAPKYWVFEYWDEGKWKIDESRLYTASENPSIKYSFWMNHFSSANHRTYIASFVKKEAVSKDFVRMRIRAVGNINGGGGTLKPTPSSMIYMVAMTYHACDIVCYKDAPAIKDTHKVSQFGNSITFYEGSAFKIKEIARREGHQLDYRLNLKGSQEFKHHLYDLIFSQELIQEGGYDFAIMQDGSFFHAQYAAGEDKIVGPSIKFTNEEILRYTDEMSKELRKYSPNAEIILENDYSYQRKAYNNNYLGFGSFDEFDKYQWMGSVAIANECKEINWIAPLGRAFSIARKEQGFTEEYNYLQYTDNYHPNNYGAYLKACVYYLIMFGEHFGDAPADCSVDSVNAKKLRDAAEKAVLTNREEFHVR